MKHLQGLVEEREPSYFAAFSLFVGAVIALEMVCREYKDLRNLSMISLMKSCRFRVGFPWEQVFKLGRVFSSPAFTS